MSILLMANNAGSTLANSISNTAVTANLQAGTGALFPAPGVGQYFVGTFTEASDPTLQEIVHVTNVTGDTITMVRAQEGTTAEDWTANDLFDNLITAGTIETFVQAGQAQSQSFNYAVDTGSANAYLGAYTPAISIAPPVGTPLSMLIANANTGASTVNFGWGLLNIVRRDGSALIGNELLAATIAVFRFDGTNAEWQGIAPATTAAITAGTDTESLVTPAQLASALGNQKQLSGQCYFQYTSATSLTLIPFNGNNVPVAGVTQQIPAGGITVSNTGVTVNGSGSATLAASSSYLVALNQSNLLEYWSLGTGYSSDTTAANIGVEVITGHATKTLVGMVATNSSGQFSAFMVLSWFNRRTKINQTNFTATRTTASGTFAEINSEIRNSFLVWATDSVDWRLNGAIETNGSGIGVLCGVGFDGITPENSISITALNGGASLGLSDIKSGLADGLHYATVLGAANSGGSLLTLYAPPYSLSAPLSTPAELTIRVSG